LTIKIDTAAGQRTGTAADLAAWLARWQPSGVRVVCPYCVGAAVVVEPPGGSLLWRDDNATRDLLVAVARHGRADCCGVDAAPAEPVFIAETEPGARCDYMTGKGNRGTRCTLRPACQVFGMAPRPLHFCARHARKFQPKDQQ